MSREPHIPLFLWVATAIVAHAIWGGGAHQAAVVLEETLDIGAFARDVRRHVRQHSTAVEVSLFDETEAPSLDVPPPEPSADAPDDAEPDDSDAELTEAELEKKKEEEEKKEQEKLEAEKASPEEKKPEEKPLPEETKPDQPPEPVQLKVPNRIAVDQHVEDKDQEDNPDAAHIAEDANHVEKETRARITSTDQNNKEATPGGHHVSPNPDPGNSDESKVAQSDDAPGAQDRPPGDAGQEPLPPAKSEPPPQQAQAAAAGGNRAPRAPEPSPPRQQQTEQQAVPHVHDHSSGRWALGRPLEEQSRQKALPPRRAQDPNDFLGLGSAGTTKNGINLNLTPQMAASAVGADQLARERRLDGERRKSAHVGSWKSLGLERWKPALENYVASVQPGNQTALNTARVPFARYLNAIHLRIHPVFADHFLGTLDGLPKSHPLNREDMSTHLEIVLSKADGRIVRMGITKSSGVTAFDVGALDSVQKASPFGAPPDAIVSPDGNVYLHWEFHRLPHYACSTYFARPYILKSAPGTAPPRVPPPRGTPPDERPYDPSSAPAARPGERSGFLHRDQHDSPQPRG